MVEFPDLPPMENFHSNTLNRTFERIIFSPIIAVNGKMQTAVAQPGSVSAANPHAGLKVEEVPAGAHGPRARQPRGDAGRLLPTPTEGRCLKGWKPAQSTKEKW